MNNHIGTVISKSTFNSETLPIHNSRLPSLSHSLHLSIPRTHQKKKNQLECRQSNFDPILKQSWHASCHSRWGSKNLTKIWGQHISVRSFVRASLKDLSNQLQNYLPPPLGPILQNYFHSTYHRMGIRWKFVHVMDNFAKYKWIGEISISIFF